MDSTRLDRPEVFAYLEQHLEVNAADFALKKHAIDLPAQELARQLSGMKTARQKFPDLLYGPGILYPPGINLEQTSSQQTAMYKGSLIQADTVLDLTGGLGVDSIAFAKANHPKQNSSVRQITHLEKNPDLQQIAAHNFKMLNLPIQSHAMDAEAFLETNTQQYDLIYVDPARRDQHQSRVFQIQDCEPDVTNILPELLNISQQIMVKLSPMLDITQALEQLTGVSEVHAVAVKNELKELLFLIKKDYRGEVSAKAINLETDQPDITTPFPPESCDSYSDPSKYLYEPNVACSKLQCYGELSTSFNLNQLAPNTHLFTGEELKNFPGRRFKIIDVMPFSRKRFKKKYAGKNYGIVSKNLNGIGILGSVKAMRKHFKLGEHERDYLFLTRLQNGDKMVIEAKKISDS